MNFIKGYVKAFLILTTFFAGGLLLKHEVLEVITQVWELKKTILILSLVLTPYTLSSFEENMSHAKDRFFLFGGK